MTITIAVSKAIGGVEPRAVEVEKGENSPSVSAQQPAAWEQFPEAHRKKVVRKMDFHILPVLMTLYSKYLVWCSPRV